MDESQLRAAKINVIRADIANLLQNEERLKAAAYVVARLTDKEGQKQARHDVLHEILMLAIDAGDIVSAQDIRRNHGDDMARKDKWMVDDLLKVEEKGTPPPERVRGGIHALLANHLPLRKTT